MASGAGLELATCGGYTFALGFHEAAGLSLMASGCAMATYHARDISVNRHSTSTGALNNRFDYNEAISQPLADPYAQMRIEMMQKEKEANVYAPDRPLPVTEHGIPIPDTDAPHTQIGTKESKRRPGEKYPQAREFDNKEKPVKTIDFTDHGEPSIHSNPHEHPSQTNPTGGTPRRGDPQPLENWKY